MEKLNRVYNQLIGLNYFTDGELRLLTDVNGYNIETLNDAIYARFGVRDFNDLLTS